MPQDEWYTPEDPYLFLVRACFPHQRIGLDPFSNDYSQKHLVKARHHFTIEDDALDRSWEVAGGRRDGSVFMNPPYSKQLIKQSTEKFLEEFANGSFGHGIILVNNSTEAGWFQNLLQHADAIAFPSHRISFISRQGKTMKSVSGNPRGQAFIYFGPRANCFVEHFSQIGSAFPLKSSFSVSSKKSHHPDKRDTSKHHSHTSPAKKTSRSPSKKKEKEREVSHLSIRSKSSPRVTRTKRS